LIYADDVDILGGSIHTIKKNIGASLISRKEIGLGVNDDKRKYMFVSCDQNAGQSHNLKIGNSSFERVEVGSMRKLGHC